ncbi:alanine dehydrogenase [Amphiplicatus metriothermophilus]|uniref:Alanine dehydrogenase n=1 Tax=Amphiplicatus metriothermophilus TaxID=1519374 RepID=A0A239PY16_9PROT|nr:alanine dehydrogenase [Amphiplicatus metriothermophilus]MBB5519955.1 alanine dehydrogenase [Amphiplicatus metriothermophilus]SNT74856.1 L-alanine dehydrogenase [Amphiplicatus metriothermophilus]
MRVGVPKEIKNSEFRVGLTPGSVREYVAHGHEVIVETGAGAGIRAGDQDYEAAGARIAPDAASVFAEAEMIVKVKEPQPVEIERLREGQILYAYLHLAPDEPQTKGLLKSGVTGVAYETVTDDRGGLPLLAPMSEVAGRLAIQAAAYALTAPQGGRGLLMGGVPGVLPAKVLVIGGGVVGAHAAKMAAGLGADVTVLDRNLRRLAELDDLFAGRVKTRYSTYEALDEETDEADVVIGAVLIPGASAPKLVTREMLKGMKDGAVLVDVSIDQGGCFETSKPTTHAEPTYIVEGVVHYCVANMPGAVPLTASHALNNATLAYGLMLADKGLDALKENRHLRNGLNVHRGKVTHEAVAAAHGLPYTPAEEALALH